MKYLGSKNRIANDIIPILMEYLKEGQYFVDLFCGGCNLIDKITHDKRIANDNNRYLIAMWKGLMEGRKYPKTIEKDLYNRAREEYKNGNKEFDDFMIGWIGWMASYNGRFFDGGYSGHQVKVKTGYRDYIGENIKNIEKQIPSMFGVKFFSNDYKKFSYSEPCLIYCDIPYKDTKQYSTSKNFNHLEFFEWCREMTKKGHTVIVSEYQAPEDFECLWEKEIVNRMNPDKTTRPTEKLFLAPSE